MKARPRKVRFVIVRFKISHVKLVYVWSVLNKGRVYHLYFKIISNFVFDSIYVIMFAKFRIKIII